MGLCRKATTAFFPNKFKQRIFLYLYIYIFIYLFIIYYYQIKVHAPLFYKIDEDAERIQLLHNSP